jgi:hypothetical protein
VQQGVKRCYTAVPSAVHAVPDTLIAGEEPVRSFLRK